MAELTRTILSRLRKYVGNRRKSTRRIARLDFTLSLVPAAQGLNGTRRIKSLNGHTIDLSANGLALVVPQITLAEHHLVGENRRLNVKLQLPVGPVEAVALPVRYERLEEDQEESGYLIGVKIVSMPDEDRAKFSQYVAGLQKERR
jgi:c-di-GMP-binding flagellar brake protein YcgR